MSTKTVQENLMDFSSPLNADKALKNEINSPGSNPFDSILQIAETFGDTDFKKDVFEPRNIDVDCGRESLGILHVDFEKLKFNDVNWLNVPNIQVNDETFSSIATINSPTVFNTAFLYSSKYSCGSSVKSSVSLLSDSLKSWNISNIPFLNPLENTMSSNPVSTLNKAFIDYSSRMRYDEKYDWNTNLMQNGLINIKQRLKSLPDTLNKNDVKLNNITQKNKGGNAIPSFRRFCKSDSLLKQSFALSPAVKPKKKEDDEIDDSVFMEANYLASKIADYSIYNMDYGELCSLDDTPQPEWPDMCDNVLDDNISKVSNEDMFKTVDKIIPPMKSEGIDDANTNNSKISSHSSSSSSLSKNECVQSLTDIFNGDSKKLSTSRLSQCSNNSKSKDAKSILHNLSEILSTDNPSAQQKSEGQNLLFNLADILCANDERNSSHDRDQSEDSGHSSIDQDVLTTDKQTDINCDALDLRVNNSERTTEEVKPLDLSISKKKKGAATVNLSKTNESTSKISLNTLKNNSVHDSTNESTYSNSRNLSHVKTNISDLPSLTKLKPKKTNQKLVQEKGPLKATIPLGHMSKPKGMNSKNRIANTPPKYGQYTPVYPIKRTSTPKTQSKLQPVAQSTPEGNSDLKKRIPISNYLKQRKSEGLTSPLSRTNSIDNNSVNELNKKNRTGSTPNLSSSSCKNTSTASSSQAILRRRSASDLKVPVATAKFKRSNTIDKDTGISKTLDRVRESIAKARNSSLAGPKAIATTTYSAPNKMVLLERNRASTSSNIKPCNLVNKLRRSSGKENSCT